MGDSSGGGAFSGMLRGLGTMLGWHIKYAQREVKNDAGRLVGGVVVIVAGALFAAFALLFAHGALIVHVETMTRLNMVQAVWAVAGGDLLLAAVLVAIGRARLRKPVLQETRSLVRSTVSSLTDLTAEGD